MWTRGSDKWTKFSIALLLSGPALLSAIFLFVVAIDPYKVLPWSYQTKPQIAEDTQRYFLPMLLRTRSFDSFIFGTSTGMLIDPKAMGAELGGTFANLAIGDGHAWEQIELLRLVQTQFPSPKNIVLTFDWVWCVPALRRAAGNRSVPDVDIPASIMVERYQASQLDCAETQHQDYQNARSQQAAGHSRRRLFGFYTAGIDV